MTERREAILAAVRTRGSVSYPDLAALARVSTMTVRRDVDGLAAEGLVFKVVGGVRDARANPALYETAVASRLETNVDEKRAIASLALDHVREGQTLYLDASSTCLHLSRAIAASGRKVTVVTNSALLCLELGRGGRLDVVGLGGQFDPESASFVGPAAERMLLGMHVDVAFTSTKGFVPAEGTYESSASSIQLKRLVAQRSDRLVLLVDHTKFGRRALSLALETSRFHEVVTDGRAPRRDLAALRKRGPVVRVAAFGRGVRV